MNDHKLTFDSEGFLSSPNLWSEQLALELARQDDIELTPLHWCVLHFLRKFYQDYRNTPPMRALVKELKANAIACGADVASISSVTLNELFPQGPLKQASKIAGLPKPARCL